MKVSICLLTHRKHSLLVVAATIISYTISKWASGSFNHVANCLPKEKFDYMLYIFQTRGVKAIIQSMKELNSVRQPGYRLILAINQPQTLACYLSLRVFSFLFQLDQSRLPPSPHRAVERKYEMAWVKAIWEGFKYYPECKVLLLGCGKMTFCEHISIFLWTWGLVFHSFLDPPQVFKMSIYFLKKLAKNVELSPLCVSFPVSGV